MAQQTLTDHRDTTPRSLYNLFYEENQAPSFRHFSLHLHENHLSPSHHGSRAHFTLERVSSPGSLSFRSPLWTPSSQPSLLHCCISSLQLDGDIYSIAVSKELVLTGSCDRRVHARQPLDCHTKGYIHASSGEIRAMVAHGDLLFTSHKDRKVRIWSVTTYGTCNNNATFNPKKVTTLPSASRFKSLVSKPITPHYKKVMSRKPIGSHHRDTISCMAYYHVEEILYTGSYDRTVKAWRVTQKKCVDSFIAHVGNVSDMVVDQQHGYLFTCSLDGTLKMWMRVVGANYSHALVKVLAFRTYPIHALALSVASSLQDSFLYSGSSNGSINFWEQCSRYTHGGFLQGHRLSIQCLATLGSFVISGSEDSTIRIWKRQIGGRNNHECLAVLEGHRGPVRCLATHLVHKDKFGMSFLVYSASSDQTFKVWRAKHLPPEIVNSPFRDDDDDDEEEKDDRNIDPDFETSPVLSPSWVKKKLQYSMQLASTQVIDHCL